MSETPLRPASAALSAHLEGQAVVLHTGTREYVRLNETAALIWERIQLEESRDEILGTLLDEFDVDRDTASRELDRFVGELRDRELLVGAGGGSPSGNGAA